MDINSKLANVGIKLPKILLPKQGFEKWATIACDQYTSDLEYWKRVENFVKDAKSTLHLTYPEIYLEDDEDSKKQRIKNIIKNMNSYIDDDSFKELDEGFILVRRSYKERVVYGLIIALDLEEYEYKKDSNSIIRATEETIYERIPPRVEIRKDCPIEFPHILVLLNDKDKKVIEPIINKQLSLEKLYDFDLMMNSGNIKGFYVNSPLDIENIANEITKLKEKSKILYAMGDGNHSFATAKECWNLKKKDLNEEEMKNHPSRYALVELENIYEKDLHFEPIHRVFFNYNTTMFLKAASHFCDCIKLIKYSNLDELTKEINKKDEDAKLALVTKDSFILAKIKGSKYLMLASFIQDIIDNDIKLKMDYIHGLDQVMKLVDNENNLGIILPNVDKDDFFRSIEEDGIMARKTFSMGESDQKRFYLEGRYICKK